jgi:hypothetical protein
MPFQPEFLRQGNQPGEFTLSEFLGSTTPGANFPIGNGLGVAVVVESSHTRPQPWAKPALTPCRIFQIRSVTRPYRLFPLAR